MKKKFFINSDEAEKFIEDLMNSTDSVEIGIFISLLSQKYIQTTKISKDQFITSLSNSLDKLEEENDK